MSTINLLSRERESLYSTTNLLEREREGLYYTPPPDPSNDGKQDILIYMITGNPGLITYYEPFLSTLHGLLLSSPASRSANFYIRGYSFTGFETSPAGNGQEPKTPVGLKDQIRDTEDQLYAYVDEHQGSSAANGRPLKVILMGHSVGAYILLELIQQHKKRVDSGEKDFDLVGGILLFPTITHIAQSPSGIVASALLKIPYAALIGGAIVRSLFYLVPKTALYNIIKLIMRFPDHAARTTANFIKSRMGIKQALHLAKEEMEFITDDKWDAEVWGTAHSPITNEFDTARWNLIFYWGQNDSLVSNRTREDLIANRGRRLTWEQDKWVADHTRDSVINDRTSQASKESEDSKPLMLMDFKGIPHAFCINHSDLVAAMATNWVQEILRKHERASSS